MARQFCPKCGSPNISVARIKIGTGFAVVTVIAGVILPFTLVYSAPACLALFMGGIKRTCEKCGEEWHA